MPSGPQTEEPPAAATSSTVLVKASWGSGPGQIGRSQPAEANPEVAASFSATSDGDLVVLDKVNGRIVRYSRDGRLKGSIAAPLTEPQELLVGSDGSMLVMDRLVDERVAVLDSNGKELGQIPITGDGLKYGGSATGLFEDEDGIYVENEHSQVIRIGDREGNPDPERPTLDGRPTRDGKSLISARLISRADGSFWIRKVDRASGHMLYQKRVVMDTPIMALVLLDSDPAGNIYVGANVGREISPEEMADEAVHVVCFGSGAEVLGMAVLPANTMAEESFRDFTVRDDGTILYMQKRESGMEITSHRCS